MAGSKPGGPQGKSLSEDSLKHQSWPWLRRLSAPLCARCACAEYCEDYSDEPGARCAIATQEFEQIRVDTIEEFNLDPAKDSWLVAEYARWLVLGRIIDRWLAQKGLFTITQKKDTTPEVLDAQPVMALRLRASSQVLKLHQVLSTVAASRAQRQPNSLASLLAKMDEGDNGDT